MQKQIYLDNAATTSLSEKALSAMMPYLTGGFGNPSSIYRMGRENQQVVEDCRADVAGLLGANAGEIYFTSGGSEADNWAIKGVAAAAMKKGKNHIISTVFEHHAVLHTLNALKRQGFEITLIPVDSEGLIDPAAIEEAITDKTALVTVMYANNEIGTVMPIKEIGAICRSRGVLFHTDAVQAVGHLHINVADENIDLLSFSAHKFHGPKGVGGLYIRRGVFIPNLIEGGGQEKGKRAGTENVAGIVGMTAALKEACEKIDEISSRQIPLRDKLISELSKIEHSRLNGHPTKRLPSNVNFSFVGVEGESLLLMLDFKGICASSGSACTSGSLDPSHVLLSLGLKHEVAHGSLRLSMGDDTTPEDIDYALSVIPEVVARLREMSPLWDKIKGEN